ncbi:MAG: hypothetical protein H7Y20_04640, partial [Bryobacteraceae bacterium]|nr:hypothetical protein [Bryobacteraceae bacterium]
TLGLWSPHDFANVELDVRSNATTVRCVKQGMSGASRLWQITGTDGATARLDAFDSANGSWDNVFVTFTSAAGSAAGGETVLVRSITAEVNSGIEDANHLALVNVPQINVVDVTSFRPGDAANKPTFTISPAKRCRMGVFAASKGNNKRAVIVMLPESGTPSRVIFGITHGFGQNAAYYGNLGWTDPLSVRLIQDVATRFVRDRWGAQVLASRKQMATVMIVRASTGGSELGPFANDGVFTHQVLESISAMTNRAFTFANVEAFTFSSGIHDLVTFVGSTQGQLNYSAIYNIDPARHAAAPHPTGVTRKQFLSGQTGGPASGFEFMPESRWQNEPFFTNRSGASLFDYLHNHCMPLYALHLGIQLS